MNIGYRFVQLILFLSISIGISGGYLYLPASYQNLDDRLRDFLFLARGGCEPSDDIIIVDIDEKSLQQIGQWPWERSLVATLLQNLASAKAGIIGLDIVFSEEDKTSPHRFARRYGLQASLPNYDEQLAKTVETTPTILGYVFNFDPDIRLPNSTVPAIPAVFIEKNLPAADYLIRPSSLLGNIKPIQERAYSSGFINNIPDPSGTIRSVPLVMHYDGSVFPSLAFEMYRIALDASTVTIEYSPTGIGSISAGETAIPVDRNGRLYLNHRGPGKTFRYLSAADVINNTFDPGLIEGKFVLIGTSAYGLMDLRANPYDNIIPGIEIHATAIDNLLNHDMLIRPDWIEIAELGAIVALAAFVILWLSLRPPLVIFSVFIALLAFIILANYLLLFTFHIVFTLFFTLLTLGLSMTAVLGMNYFFEHRQKEQVKKKFAQKVSQQVMEDLLKGEADNALQTRQLEVTVFFSDIRSFTSISEQLGSPEKLVRFLNEYMTAMAEPIIQTRGTIDKFIGDAIMAYWNAPNRVEHHADRAVQSALEQLSKRESLSQTFTKRFGVPLDFGIGLNTGRVTVGDIGSEGRSDYTIIGDAVNLASRLEGLCKYYQVRLIISEFTFRALRDQYILRELDIVRVKGKTQPIRIYEVVGQGSADGALQHELDAFHAALGLYRHRRFEEASLAFDQLHAATPHPLYALYRERCDHLALLNPETFDGVYEFHDK